MLAHRIAILALAVLMASGAQSAAAQGLRVGAPSAEMPDVCGQSVAHSLGDAATGLCQPLAAVVAERPRLSRRPTPAWSAAYEELLADALDAVYSSSQPIVAHTVVLELVKIGLEPGLLRWRQVDLAPIHRALTAPEHRSSHNARSMQGCVSLAVTVRDFPSAWHCARQALDAGHDSTWHLLRLAWLESKRDAPTELVGLVTRAINAARRAEDQAEIVAHLNAAFDSRADGAGERNEHVRQITDAMAMGFARLGDEALHTELVTLIVTWLGISEFWGGVFYGCPNFLNPGQRVLVACDRNDLPFERRNMPAPAALQLPIAEFWDPTSGEEIVAIAGLPLGSERTGPGGLLRFWSSGSAVEGEFTEIPLERLQSAAAGRVMVASVPRGVRAWFFDAGELESGESRLTGVDSADLGRGRTECLSDLFLVPSDDPEIGLGTGWVGKVPFADVLRRHQPALLGVQYRNGEADASVAGRVTITALEGRQGDVSMPVRGEMAGAISEISVGLNISRLRPGRYRATLSALVPGCSGDQHAFREFRVVE